MKKNSLIYFIFTLIAVFVSIYFFVLKKSQTNSNIVSQGVYQTSDTLNIADSETDYINFNSQNFESNKDKRRVLFFYANWCTTCRPVNAEFLSNSNQLPEDVVVYRVNYRDSDTDDTEKELAEKYKITYQHTFVQVNQQGEVIKKWNGGNLAELIKNVN